MAAAPENGNGRFRQAHLFASALAGLIGAALPLGAALWRSSVEKEQLRARVVIMEATDRGQDARMNTMEERLNRVVDHSLQLRIDVSELKGRAKR